MIKLRSIEKSYRHGLSQTFVLRRINVDIQQGEFVSIMGPSGAGKSTLLHIMGMHDSAWTGEYWLFDEPVHQLSAKERMRLQKQHVGFVFQSYHLLDNLTVYENIDLPLSYRDVKKSERQGMVADILDRFNIVGKKDLYPNQLSGGQQQLVAIARAVVAKPNLILADEPTGNLHTDQGREIMELFKRLNDAGTTIIQVTHSEVNAAYGRRIIKLKDGWVVDESGPSMLGPPGHYGHRSSAEIRCLFEERAGAANSHRGRSARCP
jgi:putative ABC transport system ATP-binding protein